VVRRRRKRKSSWLVIAALCCVVAAGILLVRDRRTPYHPLPLPHDCPLGAATAGVDVSYYQGDITWPRVYRAGVRFAFIRAYDGVDVFDAQFIANWNGAKAAGLLRGAYQYFRPTVSPIEQADALVRVLRTYGEGELPPVLDIETLDGRTLAEVAAAARLWIDRVRAELHVEPIVYTNPGMWAWRPAIELGTQPLWLAHYTSQCPVIPAPWVRWTFWQYTDAGQVPGIGGSVDLDVFDGTVDDLRRRLGR
jgi:lysozyme